jgi:Cadherin-like domain
VATHGVIVDNQDGTYTFTPEANYNGPVNLTYTVSDGKGGNTLATQTLVLDNVNDAPELIAETADLPYGEPGKAYTVTAEQLLQGFSDVDGNLLSVSELSADIGIVTDMGDGNYTITPPEGYDGVVNLRYTVVDGQGGQTAATQLFGLKPNVAPALTGTPATLAAGLEDTAFTVTAAKLLQGYSDADGGQLAVSNLLAKNAAVVANADGSYTITPNANYNGDVTLSYKVVDGQGGSVRASQTVAINPVNDAPTLTSAKAVLASGTEDTAFTVSTADLLKGYSDVDVGDQPSVNALTADHATVTDNGDGTYTVTPALNYNGAVKLSYSVIDGNGGVTAAQSIVSLASVNDAPGITAAVAQLADGLQGASYTVSVASLLQGYSDVDGGTLSVFGLSAGPGSVVTPGADNTFVIQMPAGYTGAVELNYAVLDGQGGSTAATQSFNVLAVNHVPTITVDHVAAVNEAAYGTLGATVNIDVAKLVHIQDPDASDVKAPLVAGSLGLVSVVIRDAQGKLVDAPFGVPDLKTLFTSPDGATIHYDRADFSS